MFSNTMGPSLFLKRAATLITQPGLSLLTVNNGAKKGGLDKHKGGGESLWPEIEHKDTE